MPVINLGNELGQKTLEPQRGVPSVGGLDQAAESMRNLANVGADTILAYEQNRKDMELAGATTEALKEIESKAFEFKNEDRDYGTQNTRYKEFYDELEGRYEERFGNKQQFDVWRKNVDKFAFNKGLDIKSNVLKQDAIEQQAILDSSLDDLAGIAIRGDQDQFDEVVSKGDALMAHSLEVGVIDSEEYQAKIKKFKKDLSRGKVRQDIGKDPLAALESIRNNEYEALSAEEQSQFEAMAITEIAQVKNKSTVAAKKQATELVKDTILSLNNNYLVRDDELASAELAAPLAGLQEELMIAKGSSKFITLPKATRDKMLGEITEAHGVQGAELRFNLENASETIESELDKDAYGFAVKQDIIKEIPIDLNDPTSFQARLEQAEYLSVHYGRPIPPLSEDEAGLFVDLLPSSTPKQKVLMALSFRDNDAVWSQLDRKNAGLFAMTGAIGDPSIMEGVFKGQQLLKDKMINLDEDSKTLLSAFDSIVGGAYVGRDRVHMFDASVAYYASLNAPGLESGFFSDDSFEDAIKSVSGGIGVIRGEKLELPRGIDKGDFTDYIDSVSSETVAEHGGVWGMSDKQVSDLIRKPQTGIIGVANNRYAVIVNDAMLMTGDGSKPFLLSFDADKLKRDSLAMSITKKAQSKAKFEREMSDEERERLKQGGGLFNAFN